MNYTCSAGDMAVVATFKESPGRPPTEFHFITWYAILARRINRFAFIAFQCATFDFQRDLIHEMKVQTLALLRADKNRGRQDRFVQAANGIDITPNGTMNYIRAEVMTPLAREVERSDMFCSNLPTY